MKLASYTITSSKEDIVLDAINSVKDFVDIAIVVDLGVKDRTIEIIRDAMDGRISVVKAPGNISTGDARNMGLDHAAEIGCDWAMTLDTDERILAYGSDVKSVLEKCDSDILLVEARTDTGSTYHKERFFRLPIKDRFVRHVHECVIPRNSKVAVARGIQFYELPKSPEVLAQKMQWVLDNLMIEIAENPHEARVWFYLGDAFYALGRLQESIHAFEECARLSTWNEEAAWSWMRIATMYEKLGKLDDAIQACGNGLVRHAGMPELAFYAAILNYYQGRPDQALYWCRMAIPNGNLAGERELSPRMGWSIPAAMGRMQWELLRDLYRTLGWQDEVEKCNIVLGDSNGNVRSCT